MKKWLQVRQRCAYTRRLGGRERLTPATDRAVAPGMVTVPLRHRVLDVAGAAVDADILAQRKTRDLLLHGTTRRE